MKLDQARVLLTGAAGGIGREAAEALARRGARLLLVGRQAGPLDALARDLGQRLGRRFGAWSAEQAPPDIAWLAADITRSADQALCARAAEACAVDVLVHNAGLPSFGRFDSLDAARLEALIAVNLLAPMQLSLALLPGLRRQPQAAIVAIGSALGRLGLPGHVAYGASKAGLRGFCEGLRRELADTGVRVQYLGPRAVATGFNSPEAEAHRQASGSRADPPQRVARALVELIERGEAERHLGFPERLAGPINACLPTLLDGPLGRQARSLPAT